MVAVGQVSHQLPRRAGKPFVIKCAFVLAARWCNLPHMTARPAKHSLTLHGHRTSVSLEEAFWAGFRDIAAAQGVTINALAAQIDAGRSGDEGLASAIRVYVLNHFRGVSP